MMREKLEALAKHYEDLGEQAYRVNHVIPDMYFGPAQAIRAILAAEPDPYLRDAVVDIVWWGERMQLGVDHTADRICALFEGGGGRKEWQLRDT
jgi:hypothetical protein